MSSISHPALRARSPYTIIPEGTPFGQLKVISGPFLRYPRDSNPCLYQCECACGEICEIRSNNLLSGNTTTCGCGKRNAAKTHGGHGDRLCRLRGDVIQRCTNSKNPGYRNYGGRGITVCQEWRDSYEAFRDWALANGYQDELTIERVDVNGNYEPSNCEWIPRLDQWKNLRKTVRLTAFGETKNIRDWAKDPRCTVNVNSLYYRANQGWDAATAITIPPTPPNKRRKKRQPSE